MIKWDTIIKPKSNGGLGIQQAHIKNKASLTSLAWRLYNNIDTMWAKVLIRKHYSGNQPRANPKIRTWQCIQEGWKVVHKGDNIFTVLRPLDGLSIKET